MVSLAGGDEEIAGLESVVVPAKPSLVIVQLRSK